MIGFNPSNFYALLHGTPMYGEISIFTWLLDRVLCMDPHIYSLFYRTLVLSPVLYMYAVGNFYFLVGYFFLLVVAYVA